MREKKGERTVKMLRRVRGKRVEVKWREQRDGLGTRRRSRPRERGVQKMFNQKGPSVKKNKKKQNNHQGREC